MIDVGCCQVYLRGGEQVEKVKLGRRRRVQTQNTKKTIFDTTVQIQRVRVQDPKLHRRNARCRHQRMQWSDTRSILLCSTATSPTGLSEGFFVGLKVSVA